VQHDQRRSRRAEEGTKPTRRRHLEDVPARGNPVLLNNLVLTLTGAGLLWFGFNAGSAVAVESPVAGSIAGSPSPRRRPRLQRRA
jgi:ammonia channel protein AmtB